MADRPLIKLSNRRLREIAQGLSILKERRLPSLQVELRVAAQLRTLVGPYEDVQEVRKKILREHEVPDGDAESEVKVKKQLELRTKLDELDALEIEVFAPKKKLSKEDLPQSLKGTDGEKNTVGNAGIMVALAPEFFDLPEEEES